MPELATVFVVTYPNEGLLKILRSQTEVIGKEGITVEEAERIKTDLLIKQTKNVEVIVAVEVVDFDEDSW